MPAIVTPAVINEVGATHWNGRHFPNALHQGIEWLTPLARLRHLPVLHELVGHDTLADNTHTEVGRLGGWRSHAAAASGLCSSRRF